MNGEIIGKGIQTLKGIWTPNDYLHSLVPSLLLTVPSNAAIVSALTSAAGRAVYGGSHAINTTNWKYGSSAMNLWKTSTSVVVAESYVDGLSAVNLTDKLIGCLVYIKDAATLAKLSEIRLLFGQSSSVKFYYKFKPALGEIKVGWQRLERAASAPSSQEGTPNLTSVDYNLVGFVTTANNVTTAQGDIVFNGLYYR